eukprot:1537909-Amphidinium_carterae.1
MLSCYHACAIRHRAVSKECLRACADCSAVVVTALAGFALHEFHYTPPKYVLYTTHTLSGTKDVFESHHDGIIAKLGRDGPLLPKILMAMSQRRVIEANTSEN